MRRALVGMLLALAVLTPAGAKARATTHVAATRPDPCGFRHAAWSAVQDSASLIANVVDGTIYDSYTSRIQDEWITLRLQDMRDDYGKPANAAGIVTAFYDVSANVEDLVKNSSDAFSRKYDTSHANKAQARMWALVKSMCPSNAKGFTRLGYMNAYGEKSATTPLFRAPHAWTLWWDFDCGGTGSTAFSVAIEDSAGQWVKLATNEIKSSDINFSIVGKGGWYKVWVNTSCPWHVKATN